MCVSRREMKLVKEEGGPTGFCLEEGGGACLVGCNKGDFGYLKPKLAIVYSF